MSGPRKRLAVPLLQLLDRHMRVPLRSAQRRMAEHLLNLAQVRSPVQHVRRRAVPQRMRADIGHPALAGGTMHDIAHDTLVDAAAAHAEEQRGRIESARTGSAQYQWSAMLLPAGQRLLGRVAEGHHALLAALSRNPYRAVGSVDIADVEPDEFRHADTGRVQQFQHGRIT